jgi:hypothetical protein
MLVVGACVVTQATRPGDLTGGLAVAALGEAITGLGMGLSATTILVMVQAAVPWQRRAVATGLVQFSRTIGGAVGVGLLGGIVTASVGGSSAVILDPIGRNFISPEHLAAMRSALSGGLEWVFVILALDAVVVAAVAIRMMPAVRIERRTGGVGGASGAGGVSAGGGGSGGAGTAGVGAGRSPSASAAATPKRGSRGG